MQGQCPNCKGLFEIKQEWIGMKAPCPHCHQTITLLAMPPAGSPAGNSSFNLTKSNSAPAQTPPPPPPATQFTLPPQQSQTPPPAQTQTPPPPPAQFQPPPPPAQTQTPPPPAQFQTPPPPAPYQAPPNVSITFQQVPAQTGGPSGGMGERVVAFIIDWAILFVPCLILTLVIKGIGMAIINSIDSDGAIIFGTILLNLFIYILETLIGMGYEGYFLSKEGATLGKKIMGLKVHHQGQNPTFLRGACRYLAKGLSGLICLAGYIMAFFTEENKALHDMLCDTRVIKIK